MSTQSSPSVLVLGALGYIGGTIVEKLVKTQPSGTITALIRNKEKEALLMDLGVNVVVGDLKNVDLLKALVVKSDVVINCAVPFAGESEVFDTIINGLAEHASTTGKKPVLISTAGSGSVMYGAGGEAGTEPVWSDDDCARWEALPESAFFHRNNKSVARAAVSGDISAYILMSPTVYGQGTGPGNKLSLQLPAYVRYAKRTGQAAYIGKGENTWGSVHVEDLARLYIQVFQYALAHPAETTASPESHGWDNLIYAGVDTFTWGPVITLVGDLLYARGDIKVPGAKSIGDSEGDMFMFGTNSYLTTSTKTKKFGWSPTEKNLVDSIKDALAPK